VAPIKVNSTDKCKVPLNFTGLLDEQPPGCPFKIQVALKTSLDIFVFHIPCSISVMIVPGDPLSID